jgi:hypothetical protein
MKIMGALVHPLFQSKLQMIDVGLCTTSQYDAGYDELIDSMEQHFEDKTSNHITRTFDQGLVKTNQWDSLDLAEIDNTPRAKAENIYKQYLAFMKCKYLPEMKPLWKLLWYDSGGEPIEPVYSFGPVVSRGENLPTGQNHADVLIKMAAMTL